MGEVWVGDRCSHGHGLASIVSQFLSSRKNSSTTIQQLKRFSPEWQSNSKPEWLNAILYHFFSSLRSILHWWYTLRIWQGRQWASERDFLVESQSSYVKSSSKGKTEWCQGKNFKSSSRVPGDSTIFYKSIYISLFGHDKVYWHKQHSQEVFFWF